MSSECPPATAPTPRNPPANPPLDQCLAGYLHDLAVRHYSPQTIYSRGYSLRAFIRWCHGQDLTDAGRVTKAALEQYQGFLHEHPSRTGAPLAASAQRLRLVEVRGFLKHLKRTGTITANPAAELTLPKAEHRLPHQVLSGAEIESILGQPDLATPTGLRDRAMFEVLYSTGLRRFELARLQVTDPDADRGVLTIRQGKGRRDRVIPIGRRALDWIERYRREARPALSGAGSAPGLFLNQRGKPLSPDYTGHRLRRHLDAAGIARRGGCHLFRHATATTMLNNGADIRCVQEMLGHVRLETTQIYTHVAIRRLQEVHAATHPAGDGRQVPPPPAAPLANTTTSALPPVVGATGTTTTPAQLPPVVGATGKSTTPAQLPPVVGATCTTTTPAQLPPVVGATGKSTTPALPAPVPAPDANGAGCWLPLPLPAAAGAQPPYVWAILLPYQWFADKLGQPGLGAGGHGAFPAAGIPVAPPPNQQAERQA